MADTARGSERRNELFKRLTQLFRGGPSIKRKVRAFRTPTTSTAVEVLLSFVEANEQMGPERLAPVVQLLNGYRAFLQPAEQQQGGSPEMTAEVEQQAMQQQAPGALTP